MQLKKVIFIFLIILYSINLVSAETITVSGTTGADIQNAINEAKSGDTITLPAGDYYITSRIYQKDKDLTIKGDGATLHINTGAVVHNGLFFEGSQITKQAATGKEGSNQVVLNDASRVQAGDLLKIWKDVKWCPTDYPGQMTGELYLVQSVSGNTVTLTEYLLREYPSGSDSIIYRPVEIHIEGLEIQDSESTKAHEAIALLYCVDSSVSDCTIRDSGFAGISFYCSFNVKAYDNDVRNCIKPGSGYGVGIWSGTAHADVYDNYIENCRHCITLNSDRLDTLTRDSHIYNNRCIGGQTGGAIVIDAHPIAIDWLVEGNDITVQSGWYALNDGAYNTVFQNNKIKGGYGAIIKRGDIKGGTHIIKDNTIEADNGFTYRAWGNSHCDNLVITGNTQTGGRYGVFLGNEQPETYENVIIRDNSFSRIINQGIYLDFQKDGCKAEISDNTFSKVGKQDIYINANSHAGKAIIKGNTLSKTNGLMLVGLTASDTGEIEYSYDESQEDADEEEPTHKTNTFTVTGYDGESDQEEINEALKKAKNGGTVDLGSAGTIETNGQTWETDGSADQVEINQAIKAGDYIILSGVFCINDPIILDSGTVLDGQGQATITIPDNANRLSGSEYQHRATKDYANKMVPLIRANNCKNIEITGIHFDGNADRQTDLITGRGFYNFIMPTGCNGVNVHDCTGSNSLGDFLRATKCSNVQFKDIEAHKLGHEALFAIKSDYVEMSGCNIDCRINNAARIRDSNHAYIHDNFITCSARESAGPGVQLDKTDKNIEMNVEVCNNVFKMTGGPGMWIAGTQSNYDESNSEIKIHHNAFLSTGWDWRNWQAGILISGVHNVNIYNNVFDGCSNAGIVTYSVKGLSKGANGANFCIDIQDNIITNTKAGHNTGSGKGYGISNTLENSHKIISKDNILWGNSAGNYNRCSGSDYEQDPRVNPGSSEWYWTGSAWECDYVSAEMTMRGWTGVEDIEDEDFEPGPEREFDSIFDILEVEFSDSGRTGQTSDSFSYRNFKKYETTQGIVAGYIKIIGFKDVVVIDDVPYIPDKDAILTKSRAVRSPDLMGWAGHIKKIDKKETVEIKDGIAYASLKVETSWYTIKTNTLTGEKKKSKIKTSKTVFEDSAPAYDILKRDTEAIVYAHVFKDTMNPVTRINIPVSDSIQKIEITYEENTSTRLLMLGERAETDEGLIYTTLSRCDIRTGSIPFMGDEYVIYGDFNPSKLHVEYFTPYESFPAKVEIIEHKKEELGILVSMFSFLVQLIMALYAGYKIMDIAFN